MSKSSIIFDGNCGFCNKTVIFIAKNDKNNNYIFVSSYSKFGTKLLLKHNIKGLEKTTIILENKIYTKSIAIRRIILKLPYYKVLGFFMFLFPIKLSNFVYDFMVLLNSYSYCVLTEVQNIYNQPVNVLIY